MLIVSNTSPIIFLEKLGVLNLLSELFSPIHVPEAGYDELRGLSLPQWINKTPISSPGRQFVEGALGRLHTGELEAMVLAREIQAEFVLLDDFLARKKAQRMGLSVLGTIGILILANKKKLSTAEATLQMLDELIHQHGFYISGPMIEQIKSSIA